MAPFEDAEDGSPHVCLASESAIHGHLVAFYERDEFLAASVGEFLTPSLAFGQTAIIVATPEHHERFHEALDAAGIDVASARAHDRLISVDAADCLARFMIDGAPDPARFRTVVGGLIERASADAHDVRVHGEMVALLWDEGNIPGAIALEDLWNELIGRYPMTLLCTYPMRSFTGPESAAAFQTICQQHSVVIPSEGYSDVADPDERLPTVASLQQQSHTTLEDRAARQATEDELRATVERLRELDRLRNEFVATAVHEIRAPATVIRGLLETVRSGRWGLGEEELEDVLTRALNNAEEIRRLSDEMLDVARLDSGEFTCDLRPIDLGDVIRRVTEDLRIATGRAIDVSLDPELPEVLADEQRQAQILRNLLTNALRFSPDPSTVAVSATVDGDQIVVRVRDEGQGIPAEQRDGLFRPFTRLDGVEALGTTDTLGVGGTGLGLYIARTLVEGQGGSIWVDSTEGRGSSFSYTVLSAGGRGRR